MDSVYVETTVIGHLVGRLYPDPAVATRQKTTREWWPKACAEYRILISQFVLDECSGGDPEAARARLNQVALLPVLETDRQARELASRILATSALPAKATADALHIAVATVNGLEFLLTWNCTHIANGFVMRAVARLSREMGYEPPTVVTPEELMEG